jgi:hypothetical protein
LTHLWEDGRTGHHLNRRNVVSGKIEWTDDLLKTMDAWRDDNEATLKQTAEHFKVPESSYGAARWARGAKLKKASKGKVSASAKKPSYIDLPSAPHGEERFTVILCPVSQIKSLLGELT